MMMLNRMPVHVPMENFGGGGIITWKSYSNVTWKNIYYSSDLQSFFIVTYSVQHI